MNRQQVHKNIYSEELYKAFKKKKASRERMGGHTEESFSYLKACFIIIHHNYPMNIAI